MIDPVSAGSEIEQEDGKTGGFHFPDPDPRIRPSCLPVFLWKFRGDCIHQSNERELVRVGS